MQEKVNNKNESFLLQLFYEYFPLGLFVGKKTVSNIKHPFFETQNKERKGIY